MRGGLRTDKGRMMDRVRFRLKQHGIPVAWAEGSSALNEIMRYAFVYRQDGPVLIEHHSKGRWRKFGGLYT